MSNTIKVNYYDTFRCIADQCSLTCCQEWRIGVDDDTLDKWKNKAIKSDNQKENKLSLCDYVKREETGHSIALNKEKKCPFLNQDKLCKLVIELGEAYLSETCTTFPRQINTFKDRIEYSLDPGCPAVVDLLKEHADTLRFEGVAGVSKEFLLYEVRKLMLEIIEDEAYSLPERIMMIFYILLELLGQKKLTIEKINNYKDKKQLQPLAQAIRKMRFNPLDTFFEGNELFLDVVHNYRKQKLYVEYLEPIAVEAEALEEKYETEVILEKLQRFEEELSKYNKLIKNYLVTEIFGNCLMPEMSLEDMVVSFQWITMEYAVLKQAIFLNSLIKEEQEIAYEAVRNYVTVISRVTGYDESDIREYMESSFEEVVWEWGYLALIVGHSKM